jgi:protease I
MRATQIAAIVLTGALLGTLVGCGKHEASTTAAGTEQELRPHASDAIPLTKPPDQEGEKTVTGTGGDVLMVLAPQGFKDEEFAEPKAALEAAGYNVVVASLQTGTCTGAGGATAEATIAADDVVPTDYAGVVFVGGPGMVEHLDNQAFTNCAQGFADNDLVVAAICVAPAILANAGVLDGVEATVFESERDALEKGGAKLSSDPVVVSGRIVTANGPAAAADFGQRLVALLDEQ